jgi:uncharacterized protein (DUF427 family)
VTTSGNQHSDRPVLEPGPDHPITITPASARIVVMAGDQVVADSANALTLQEANYPPAHYVPLADIQPDLLRPTDTQSYCPYKGDCSYYSIATGDGAELTDAAWTYQQPYAAVEKIAGYLAFYPSKVTITLR